jgi:hypothetical protein
VLPHGASSKEKAFWGILAFSREAMNYPAASYGVSNVFRHAGLDPASSLSFSGFRPTNDVGSRSPE